MTMYIKTLSHFIVMVSLFSMIFSPKYAWSEQKVFFKKSLQVDAILAIRENTIVTSSDVHIFSILTSCRTLQAEILNIQEEEQRDYVFLYLLSITLYNESNSLFDLSTDDIVEFITPLQQSNINPKCSLANFSSKMIFPIAEHLMYTDLYLKNNFVKIEDESKQDYLDRYIQFAQEKIGKVYFVGDNFATGNTTTQR